MRGTNANDLLKTFLRLTTLGKKKPLNTHTALSVKQIIAHVITLLLQLLSNKNSHCLAQKYPVDSHCITVCNSRFAIFQSKVTF